MTRGETRIRKRIAAPAGVALALLAALLVSAVEPSVHGGGATFPFPLYAKWAYLYHQKTGVTLNYQSIGSGGGLRQIASGTVEFGGSEAPLEREELERNGLIQFPMVVGGVVIAVNLPGVAPGGMRLDGPTLAGIYLGRLKAWNDPAIKALNPGLALPGLPISVVHRADGSGTSWLFTHYLAAVSPAWAGAVGAGIAVAWPVGAGGKGNEGVASFVRQIPGSVGYLEATYARQTRLATVLLKNASGKYVEPATAAFLAAAEQSALGDPAQRPPVLLNLPGEGTWPIVGASYVLLRKEQPDRAQAANMLKFFDWCLHEGAAAALELGYVPLPASAVERVERSWEAVRAGGKPVWPAEPREGGKRP
jgi:phosphate transport system substrate-binding protein